MKAAGYPLTVGQEDAGAAAYTALDVIRYLRNEAVTDACRHLLAGHPLQAQARLKAAVERQARLAGCGHVDLPAAPGHYRPSPTAEAWAQKTAKVILRRREACRHRDDDGNRCDGNGGWWLEHPTNEHRDIWIMCPACTTPDRSYDPLYEYGKPL